MEYLPADDAIRAAAYRLAWIRNACHTPSADMLADAERVIRADSERVARALATPCVVGDPIGGQ
jgi:hypothetical protein